MQNSRSTSQILDDSSSQTWQAHWCVSPTHSISLHIHVSGSVSVKILSSESSSFMSAHVNTTDPFLFVFPFSFFSNSCSACSHTQLYMCFLCFSRVNPDLWISVLCEVNCGCERIKEEKNGPAAGCSTRKGIKEESRKRKDVYRG